ncbi:uncharacterized protein LOC130686726 [Daphnia carinata]|uniref:uncharacterized protein LOC130686726 n=1 Tax=Daphnia carinata TaxID=120202 RepID=UPI00257FA6EC|nr:uncharacterized protein LOC130686726 [Daphnia carinata]
MARVDLAAGLLFLSSSLVLVSAHPPHASAGTAGSFKQGRTEFDPWRRHGEQFDDHVDPVQDDWSAGFGRRLSVIQRRQGSLSQQTPDQLRAQLRARAEVSSTTSTTTTTTATPSTTAIPSVNKAEASASIIRLIRKRLPENRSPPTSDAIGKLANGTLVNETVQPALGEVTEESFISAETAIVELREIGSANIHLTPTANVTEAPPTPSTRSTSVAATSSSTAAASPSTTTTTATTTATATLSSSNKPPWRVRMEQNQSNRRGQSTTARPAVEAVASWSPLPQPSISTTTTTLPTVQKQELSPDARINSSSRAEVVAVPAVPALQSSQNENAVSSSAVLAAVIATVVTNSRPIQSSRITVASSLSPPPPPPAVLWTPIVRLPVTGSRNIPSGTLKIQITSTRLPPLPVTSSTPNPKLMESEELDDGGSQEEEDNVVKTASSSSSTTSGRIYTTSTTKMSTTTTTTTTTTEAPTTIKASTVTTRKALPPTPVMHSLEDILQRLVPARDHDHFGSNPFLAVPAAHRPTPVVPPTTSEDANEIVSAGDPVLRASVGISRAGTISDLSRSDRNQSTSGSNNWTADSSNKENQAATTSIYVVGVVAVIPLAGLILWIVRVQLHKRRERLNESETSSETGFRKRLPPVALTPSKHARLFYGANDKEDLVSGSVSAGGNGGPAGGKSASSASPWEFTRSRLRLQTLIGEGNFGQVWKAEAEDICGCQGTLLVAVKTVKDGAAAKEKQELLREMRIMQQVGPHPNVVALLGCCTEQEPFLLIMEYVMYGRLLTFLRDHRSHQTYYNYSTDSEALTSRDLTTFAYCVAKGMEYIYSKGVVHRDLAARNVLVDHNKLCKVADFGLSRSVRDTAGEMYEQRVKGALPIRWMAPESLIQSVFTQKSDVWSFGILVWEIVTLGSTPYPGMEAREVMRRVKDGHRLERPSHCRPEFYRLMSRCWHSDPQRRPDFGELKAELGQLLDDADGYIDLDNFQESIYVPLESPSDESEKV